MILSDITISRARPPAVHRHRYLSTPRQSSFAILRTRRVRFPQHGKLEHLPQTGSPHFSPMISNPLAHPHDGPAHPRFSPMMIGGGQSGLETLSAIQLLDKIYSCNREARMDVNFLLISQDEG